MLTVPTGLTNPFIAFITLPWGHHVGFTMLANVTGIFSLRAESCTVRNWGCSSHGILGGEFPIFDCDHNQPVLEDM